MAKKYKKRTPEERKALVQETLDELLEKLTNEETFPEIMGKSVMVFDENVPSRKWSLRNRLIMATRYAFDARTYGGWKAVGRFVKKGGKGFYILEPGHKYKDNENGEKEIAFTYFYPSIRFGWKETEGDPMPYEDKLDEIHLETLPLSDVAEAMGLKVNKSFTSHGEAGYADYRAKEIVMCDNDELTFLHELSHHIDFELHAHTEEFKKEVAMREIVAEFASCFLASMYGLKTNLGFTKKYVKVYSKKKHVAMELTKAMARVEAIFEHVQILTEKRITVMNSTEEEIKAAGKPVPLF